MRGTKGGGVALAIAVVAFASLAQAEVIGGANVRASFNGWLTPQALPRSAPAPVALHLKGTLTTSDGREPPPLEKVTIAINRYGKVYTQGLPACHRASLIAASTAQALARCRGSLVGNGSFSAYIAIPTQPPFPARGRLLAFSSRLQGRRVILVHIFGTEPVPTSQVLTLTFQKPSRGTFATTLTLRMPELASGWGHVKGFELALHRRYRYRGRLRSVVSASCPAPDGFDAALFSAAKGTYYLADGRKITRVITGNCKVRRSSRSR